MNMLALAVAVTLAAVVCAQDPLVVPLADRHPEVADLSSWIQRVEHRGGVVDKSRRGVFPVGNGHVFGYFGLAERAATVQALSGPTYQTDEAWAPHGHFGEQTFVLRANDKELSLPHQTVARVRGANIVVTEDRSDDGVALVTLNFTVPGDNDLYRIVEIRNGTKAPLHGVELVATASQAQASGTDALHAKYASTTRPFRATFRFAADGIVHDDTLVRPFGELAAGQTVHAEFVIHTYTAADTQLWVDPVAGSVERKLPQCLAWWKQRLANTATVTSSPPHAADLIEDWKVLLLVQRSAAAGLPAGMVNHRVCRVRDLAGPLLLCLRYNLWNDARAMLQAVFRATCRSSALAEELPLDVAWSEADEVLPEWSKVAIPAGDVASLVVLFHEWYWRASGDLALIRRHAPLLQRCLDGQRFTPDGLQAFSGREAPFALHRLLGGTLDDSALLVAHDGAAGRSALSLDAGALYLMAYMAVGELRYALAPPPDPPQQGPTQQGAATTRLDTEYLRRTIEVALVVERFFWQQDQGRFAPALSPIGLVPHPAPVANSNLALQWLGWTFASTEKNRRNLQGTLRDLWRAPDAVRVGMTPGTGYATGETQALLLYALADLDDRARDGALAELLRIAGPAGEWGELHGPDGLPTALREPQWPGRCQPGASGIAIDAICFSLTGLRYAAVPSWDDERQARFRPRLPPATKAIDFRDIRRDGRHLHMHMDEHMAKLTPPELEQQTDMLKAGMIEAKDAKDPLQDYLRFTYRIDMQNPPPDDQHIVCAVNLGKHTLMRYLAQTLPSFGDTGDQPIDQQKAWPAADAKVEPWRAGLPGKPAAAYDTLLFTARPDAAQRHGGDKQFVVDVGLPLDPARLPQLWLADGKPLCKRIVFDLGTQAGGALTAKAPGFWQHPAVREALAAFVAAGGVVEQ